MLRNEAAVFVWALPVENLVENRFWERNILTTGRKMTCKVFLLCQQALVSCGESFQLSPVDTFQNKVPHGRRDSRSCWKQKKKKAAQIQTGSYGTSGRESSCFAVKKTATYGIFYAHYKTNVLFPTIHTYVCWPQCPGCVSVRGCAVNGSSAI